MILLTGIWAKLIAGSIAVLTSVRFGAGLYFWRQTELLERPEYTVIQQLSDGVELRKYEPYLIAETIVDGVGFKEPTGDGFRSCAKYIFGKNKPRATGGRLLSLFHKNNNGDKGEAMAMTAPVRVDGSNNNNQKTKVSFVVGKKYSLKTAPIPIDKNVKLRQVPSHTLAVRKFSGPPPNDERVEKERKRVVAALQTANIEMKDKSSSLSSSSANDSGNTLVMGYHDPFITPNFLRRNEVALVVEGNM